ncbi:PDDEXK nuclease domain-containing protein [Fibrobacter succinogenes]|uniref:PDDEXK nuclease domain-containing protein n=1 Tax=Fibrobacter succinogenes TaxID=833 RepID=UPI00156A602C|nr:PDDEXK nuclease domain-containing protein [Fibrobacter succinogenes]
MKSKEVISVKLVQDAKQIIETARENAVRSVDFCRVQMYWKLGKRIFEEEQHGKKRADYGAYIVKSLAEKLDAEYGSGFGIRQIERARQFFLLYPIASAVRTQLNWSQYKMLIAISDPDKREYYELEAVNNSWNGRELERQINSQLYERLLLSNDKESVLAVARKERIPETPQEVIKDPMVLLGFENKTGKITHQDIGQLQMYVNYHDRIEKLPDENPTIGILLCAGKNDSAVKMTLPEGNKTILATEYNLYLPTTEQLVGEINEAKELVKKRTAMQQLSADAEMAGAIKKNPFTIL